MTGKYLVVFKDGATKEQIQKYEKDVNDNGGQVTRGYEDGSILKVFTAVIPDQFVTTLQSFQGDVIDYIEPDGVVTTQ